MVSLSHPTEKPPPIPEPPDPHPGELPEGRGGTTASAWLYAGWRPRMLTPACDANFFLGAPEVICMWVPMAEGRH